MKSEKNVIIAKRVIVIYDKQAKHYVKSIPLEMDLEALDKLLKPYTDDPLTLSYEITPEMSVLLEKFTEFDFNRFQYTMEENGIWEIAVYEKKTGEYEEIGIPLKIDLDDLNRIFKQYEDDPLFYYCYKVTPKLLKELRKYIVGDNDINFDFKRFNYFVEAHAME